MHVGFNNLIQKIIMGLFKSKWKNEDALKRESWILNSKNNNENQKILKYLIENDSSIKVRSQALIKLDDFKYIFDYLLRRAENLKNSNYSLYEISDEAEKYIFEILKKNKDSIPDREIYKLIENQPLNVNYLQLLNDEKYLKMLTEKYDSNAEKEELVKAAFRLISDKDYIRDRIENNSHVFYKAINYCDNDYIIFLLTQDRYYCDGVINLESQPLYIKAEIIESMEKGKSYGLSSPSSDIIPKLSKDLEEDSEWQRKLKECNDNIIEYINSPVAADRWMIIDKIKDDVHFKQIMENDVDIYVRRRAVRYLKNQELLYSTAMNDQSEYVRCLAGIRVENNKLLEELLKNEKSNIVLKYLAKEYNKRNLITETIRVVDDDKFQLILSYVSECKKAYEILQGSDKVNRKIACTDIIVDKTILFEILESKIEPALENVVVKKIFNLTRDYDEIIKLFNIATDVKQKKEMVKEIGDIKQYKKDRIFLNKLANLSTDQGLKSFIECRIEEFDKEMEKYGDAMDKMYDVR